MKLKKLFIRILLGVLIAAGCATSASAQLPPIPDRAWYSNRSAGPIMREVMFGQEQGLAVLSELEPKEAVSIALDMAKRLRGDELYVKLSAPLEEVYKRASSHEGVDAMRLGQLALELAMIREKQRIGRSAIDYSALAVRHFRAAPLASPDQMLWERHAIWILSHRLWQYGYLSQAGDSYGETRKFHEQRDPRSEWAFMAIINHAHLLVRVGKQREAESVMQQADQFLARNSPRRFRADYYKIKASIVTGPDRKERGRELLGNAIEAYMAEGDFHGVANCHFNLGLDSRGEDRMVADYHFSQAIKFYEMDGSHAGMGLARTYRGEIQFLDGKHHEALATLKEAEIEARANGRDDRLIKNLFLQFMISNRLGMEEDALRLAYELLPLYRIDNEVDMIEKVERFIQRKTNPAHVSSIELVGEQRLSAFDYTLYTRSAWQSVFLFVVFPFILILYLRPFFMKILFSLVLLAALFLLFRNVASVPDYFHSLWVRWGLINDVISEKLSVGRTLMFFVTSLVLPISTVLFFAVLAFYRKATEPETVE